MFRLFFALLALAWSLLLDSEGAGGGSEAGDDADGASAGGASAGGEPVGKYTDKDVDKFKGDARSQGRDAEKNRILKELGVDDLEAAKSALSEYRTIEEATQTDVERIQAERDALKNERDAFQQERDEALKLADARLVNAKTETALLTAGVDAKRIPKILGDSSLTKPTLQDGNPTGLDAFVASAKEEYPEWFGGSNPAAVPQTPGGSSGTGGGGSDQSPAERARQRRLIKRK